MARRRAPLLAALICCLLLTACAGTNANQPVRTGSEQGYPDVGNAVSIAQQLQEVIIDGDFDGFVLTFPDFIADLQFFGQRVLPLMADAGFTPPLHQVSFK